MSKTKQKKRRTIKAGIGFEEVIETTSSNNKPTEESIKNPDDSKETMNNGFYKVHPFDGTFGDQYMKFMLLGGVTLFLVIIGLAILAIVA